MHNKIIECQTLTPQIAFPDYKPVEYTAPVVLSKPLWADNPDHITYTRFPKLLS